MSDALVPLDPHSPQAKEAVLALLGTTLAELKAIDRNVVGSSKNIAGNRTNLEDVFKITTEATPSKTAQQPTQASQVTVTFTPPQPTTPIVPVTQTIINEDPNQLVFDFNQKITPDIINNKLDRILDKLDRVLDKINKL